MISKGNHVKFTRFVLLAVSEEAKTFRSMYNKTIIRFGFCGIQSNQDIGKGNQTQPSASANNSYLDLDYSGYQKQPHPIIVYNRLAITITTSWPNKIIGCPRHSHVSSTSRALYINGYSLFRLKEVLKRLFFNFEILLLIQLISNWTEWSTIQGVMAPVISNRPRATRSSDFAITLSITP